MSGDLADILKTVNETPLFLKNVLHRDERTAKIIKLFGSLFAISRGAADDIQQGISEYLRFNYQEEIATALEAAVEQYRDSPTPFEEALQALRTSWDVAAKAFFAIKVCEILRKVEPAWARRLRAIGQNLGLPESVLGFVGAVVDPGFAETQPPSNRPVQFRLGPTGSANCFCVRDLPDFLYITCWQNDFYVSAGRTGASLDGKAVPPSFAFRFDLLSELRFGRFRLLYRQLQLLQRWFHQGTNGVPKFSLKKEGQLLLRRPSEGSKEKTCTLKPTYLAITEGGGERRVEWQDRLEVDGTRTRANEVAEVILALSGAGEAKGQRSASSCLLELDNVGCNFGKMRGLREISCVAAGGQMVAVMGPSGCGKSTLLGTMIGAVPLTAGNMKMNGIDLSRLVKENPRLLGYVPQDNITFATLTVAENLSYGARLRLSEPTKSRVDDCVNNVLEEIDLKDRATVIVGDEDTKTLSGGQRKRVSLGLELLTPKSLLLLDEPTSGLSSGDSERILRILRARADAGALVFVVIHQPSAELFRLFDRLLLLDRGGVAAFYGDPLHARAYLEKVAPVPSASDADEFDPGSLLAALEAPARQVDGRTEERRMFDPEYWKARYDGYRRRHFSPAPGPELTRSPADEPLHGWLLRQMQILFERSLRCKLRDHLGLGISLITAIFLGLVVGKILSSNPVLKINNLFVSFPFLSSIVALFIGMSSSITEVLRERPILRREKLLKVNLTLWLGSKFATLVLTDFVPIFLYTVISMYLLQVPESLWGYLFFLWLVSAVGVALGLAISSVPNIKEAAATNALPLILVPQLVLAGADPFKFGDLQPLVLFPEQVAEAKVEAAQNDGMLYLKSYTNNGKKTEIHFRKTVPEVAALMPSRWAYEGLISLYTNHSRWIGAEQVEFIYQAWKNAATTAENSVAKSEEAKDIIHSITALLGDISRRSKNLSDKYQTQFTDQIFGNDKASKIWDRPHETLLVRFKTIPFTSVLMATEWYNAVVLALMAFITLLVSRILLSSWAQAVVPAMFGLVSDRISQIRRKLWSRAR
ncbi:MAG: ATP-binding cassette domain-containing protein [Chthoniobacterales bacterium]